MKIKVILELTKEQEAMIVENHLSKKENSITFSLAKSSRMLGISESTIHRRIKDGLITTTKVRKSQRITPEEIERFKKTLI